MSTRSQMKIKGSEVMIYKHSDGYPEGVIPTLKKVLSQFVDERGNEPDYALAQIMRGFARAEEKRRQEILANKGEKFLHSIYEKPSMTGWGLDTNRHGDIEFLYEIDLDKKEIKVNNLYDGSYHIERF